MSDEPGYMAQFRQELARTVELRARLAAAEARAETLEDQLSKFNEGPYVPEHQYVNACKQREEAFARAREAEARVKELEALLNYPDLKAAADEIRARQQNPAPKEGEE